MLPRLAILSLLVALSMSSPYVFQDYNIPNHQTYMQCWERDSREENSVTLKSEGYFEYCQITFYFNGTDVEFEAKGYAPKNAGELQSMHKMFRDRDREFHVLSITYNGNDDIKKYVCASPVCNLPTKEPKEFFRWAKLRETREYRGKETVNGIYLRDYLSPEGQE